MIECGTFKACKCGHPAAHHSPETGACGMRYGIDNTTHKCPCERFEHRCAFCADQGVVEAARVDGRHGLTFVAWSNSVVIDCPRCSTVGDE